MTTRSSNISDNLHRTSGVSEDAARPPGDFHAAFHGRGLVISQFRSFLVPAIATATIKMTPLTTALQDGPTPISVNPSASNPRGKPGEGFVVCLFFVESRLQELHRVGSACGIGRKSSGMQSVMTRDGWQEDVIALLAGHQHQSRLYSLSRPGPSPHR
jgi:hypothetical protein